MMGRKQALIDLRDKVNAGECYPKDILSVFPHYVGDCGQWAHDAYFHGSLDAAKALHKAVLPGWGWQKEHWDGSEKPGHEIFWVTYPAKWRVGHVWKYNDKNDARAWLLAILEALIAQECDT